MPAERKLSPVEREKVAQLLAGNGNMSDVCRALGIDPTMHKQAMAVANNRKVQVRAQEILRTKFERKNISGDRVLTELARLAFASAKDMFDPATGKMIEIHEMDDDTAATIVGFDVEERAGRDGSEAYTVKKVKRGDKLGALTVLAKHFKLVSDNDGVNALAGALADRLNAAKKRVLPVDDVSDVEEIFRELPAEATMPEPEVGSEFQSVFRPRPAPPPPPAPAAPSVEVELSTPTTAKRPTPKTFKVPIVDGIPRLAPGLPPAPQPEGDDDEVELW
jgi:phage terminase small subunit